jgi:hypothetical protein
VLKAKEKERERLSKPGHGAELNSALTDYHIVVCGRRQKLKKQIRVSESDASLDNSDTKRTPFSYPDVFEFLDGWKPPRIPTYISSSSDKVNLPKKSESFFIAPTQYYSSSLHPPVLSMQFTLSFSPSLPKSSSDISNKTTLKASPATHDILLLVATTAGVVCVNIMNQNRSVVCRFGMEKYFNAYFIFLLYISYY